MGRPRVHDAQTAANLLLAAEQLIEADGLEALSMRALAERLGASTRAIYSVFESKDELLAHLAARAFEVLGHEVSGLPVTDDPQRDLVDAGMAFRSFALLHPSLYQLAFGLDRPTPGSRPSVRSAQQDAMGELVARISRVVGEGVDRTELARHALAYHALCEGLGSLERRGALRAQDAEKAWRTALATCVRGIAP